MRPNPLCSPRIHQPPAIKTIHRLCPAADLRVSTEFPKLVSVFADIAVDFTDFVSILHHHTACELYSRQVD
jgi:hypothetical protein